MPQAGSRQVLRFGVFEANLVAQELRKHGTRVRLAGQSFRILSMLLEKPGEVVTREEMQQRLWPADTFVDFEHSLNSAIKKLRGVLGDSPDNSRYIETIPRVGYRFIAPVQEVTASGGAGGEAPANPVEPHVRPAPLGSRRSWPRFVVVGTAIVALGVVAALAWRMARPHPESARERVALAVLPFSNLTGGAGQEYF